MSDDKLFRKLNELLHNEATWSYYRCGDSYAIFSDTAEADVFNGSKEELEEFLIKELKRLHDDGFIFDMDKKLKTGIKKHCERCYASSKSINECNSVYCDFFCGIKDECFLGEYPKDWNIEK